MSTSLLCVLLGAGQEPPAGEMFSFLKTQCIACHSAERAKGGIDLATFKTEADVAKNAKLWRVVISEVHERRMPPSNRTPPKEVVREQFLKEATEFLDKVERGAKPVDPGRGVVRRLTRREYNNTVRDLFGVTTKPADKFPSDGGGGAGFDNNAATLYLPPILLERYLFAADEVARAADPATLFVVKPTNDLKPRDAARKNLEKLLPIVYRRPLRTDDVERLLRLFDESYKRTNAFEESFRSCVKAMLVSPNFLFRLEAGPSQPGPQRVNDHELAVRLSYFLWCSTPDAELLKLADERKLGDPATLDAQVQRMLRDPKAKEFAADFAEQWLGLRSLIHNHSVDAERFPQFTDGMRHAMAEEAILLVQHVLKEGRSVVELLDAEYAFLNERLADHYGLPGVKGDEFRLVKLPDRRRGGVITSGAVLTMTSYSLRSSPVLRGKWVLEEILGSPAPPPPNVVAVLPPDDRPKNGKTFRQRLEQHRERAECASCHAKIDPLGFGLENFDAVGRWREEIGGAKVDSAGVLTSGEQFSGPVELKSLLRERKDKFVRVLAEKLLGYAIGRGVESIDAPTIARIVETTAKEGDGAHVLVREIVRSLPFQYRVKEGMKDEAN
jgi:hypothetical protein